MNADTPAKHRNIAAPSRLSAPRERWRCRRHVSSSGSHRTGCSVIPRVYMTSNPGRQASEHAQSGAGFDCVTDDHFAHRGWPNNVDQCRCRGLRFVGHEPHDMGRRRRFYLSTGSTHRGWAIRIASAMGRHESGVGDDGRDGQRWAAPRTRSVSGCTCSRPPVQHPASTKANSRSGPSDPGSFRWASS